MSKNTEKRVLIAAARLREAICRMDTTCNTELGKRRNRA